MTRVHSTQGKLCSAFSLSTTMFAIEDRELLPHSDLNVSDLTKQLNKNHK